ncbi:TPR repeat-containing protein [Pseudomonas syringae pv. cilantro]|uniref:TPR repeat-containing protein n=3 Tax=Pseudomonas TaxID=286 RepID=A0A0N0GHE1_PSESX|nr:TPR repeat-containing protein [Pseudomonas syringae pv. cilantro]KPW81318.1 TPR repeat-containing protein [Pseudomonas syringae pv. coriandricola]RMN07120.1 TPR repeat-containing protein [Pseudomonas syringae pv. coriandricola]
MMKTAIAMLCILTLSGCASDGRALWTQTSSLHVSECPKLTSDQEFALNLAQNMADEGRLHASLANLEGLPDSLGEVRLRKARVLRLLGSNEAEPLYRSLLGTCRAAQGEHGLGQLAAARGDNALAQQHLLRASKLQPTDEKIRNDLGVVYLNQLQLEQARFQFLTAMELKQSDSLAAMNLATLLIYQNKWTQAAELASRAGLTPEQITDARARAEQLRKTPATGSPPASPGARLAGQQTRPTPEVQP